MALAPNAWNWQRDHARSTQPQLECGVLMFLRFGGEHAVEVPLQPLDVRPPSKPLSVISISMPAISSHAWCDGSSAASTSKFAFFQLKNTALSLPWSPGATGAGVDQPPAENLHPHVWASTFQPLHMRVSWERWFIFN